MKKNVLIFGIISGLIITGMMLYSVNQIYNETDFKGNDFIGYAALIAAFSFIFIGIKNFRDNYNNGSISFERAFKIGFLITAVASTIYVATWLVDYYIFKPGFIDRHVTCVLNDAKADGASAAELDKKTTEMANYKEMYKNAFFVILVS